MSVFYTDDEVHGVQTLRDLHNFTRRIFGRGKTLLDMLLFKCCLVFFAFTFMLCRYILAPSAFVRRLSTTLLRATAPGENCELGSGNFLRRLSTMGNTRLARPSAAPAVTDTRRVPIDPWAIWHLIDVSDSHSVASHPVCPTLVPAV